jgi:hypothetical protein
MNKNGTCDSPRSIRFRVVRRSIGHCDVSSNLRGIVQSRGGVQLTVGSIELARACSSWCGVVRAGIGLFELVLRRSSWRGVVRVVQLGLWLFKPPWGRFASRLALRTSVGSSDLTMGRFASRLVFRPSVGSFDLTLGRITSRSASRPSVGSFNLTLGRFALCLAFRAYAQASTLHPGIRAHPGVRSPQIGFDSHARI